MKRFFALGLLAALAAISTGAESCSTETAEPAKKSGSPTTNKADGNRKPNPDGTFAGTCDYLLGDFSEGTESGYKLVAGGDAKNTGNIGIVARLDAKWDQLGSEPVTASKTVRLQPGQTKDINVSVLATQGQIDAHQSANGDCDTELTIVSSFGKPQ
jgi:hypothetical protein